MNKPKEGRLVCVTSYFPEEHTYCGKVEALLALQFTVRGKDDTLRYAFYKDEWVYKTDKEKKNGK